MDSKIFGCFGQVANSVYAIAGFVQLLEIGENYEMFFQSGKSQGILKFY